MLHLIPADGDFSCIIQYPEHPKENVPGNPVFGVIGEDEGIQCHVEQPLLITNKVRDQQTA